MQSSIIVRMTEGRQAHGWLHKATEKAETLIVVCHGHNSNGGRGRFIILGRWFEHHKYDCIRWDAVRQSPTPNTFTVLTVTEEYEQLKAMVANIRSKYKRIVAVGHSQGALLALKLCADGLAHVYVSLMGVGDTVESLERKKLAIGTRKLPGHEFVEVILPNGNTFQYPETFFTDFSKWNVADMLAKHHGPSLFVAATRDMLVPTSEVEEAFNHAHPPKRFETVDDEHNFSDETARLLAHLIRDWLETARE